MIVTTVELINKGTQANGSIAYKIRLTFVGGEVQYLPTRHLPADLNIPVYAAAIRATYREHADRDVRDQLENNGLGTTVTPIDTPVATWRQEILADFLGNDSPVALFSYIKHVDYLDNLPDNYLTVTMGLDAAQIVLYREWVVSIQVINGIEDDFVVITP